MVSSQVVKSQDVLHSPRIISLSLSIIFNQYKKERLKFIFLVSAVNIQLFFNLDMDPENILNNIKYAKNIL